VGRRHLQLLHGLHPALSHRRHRFSHSSAKSRSRLILECSISWLWGAEFDHDHSSHHPCPVSGTFTAQRGEIAIGVEALNLMVRVAKPISVRVAQPEQIASDTVSLPSLCTNAARKTNYRKRIRTRSRW
jgi:hypothetical protein